MGLAVGLDVVGERETARVTAGHQGDAISAALS